MLVYFKRNQLNIEKYDACINNSINSRIYAFSWYLDIVADNWDALVLNDYEAVMPLPWRQKYFIKYIYPPAWTQQLGVFSSNIISEKLILDFIKAIPRKFKKVTIQFNSGNTFQHKNVTERVNYILALNKPYEEIYKGFNKNRKRVLNRINNDSIIARTIDLDELVLLAEKYYSFLNYTDSDYEKLKILKNYLLSSEKLIVFGISNLKGNLIGGILFFKSNFRITYLFSIMAPFAKNNNISSEIINLVIKKFSNTKYIIDFEGSMDLGISSFFKSFGAVSEIYCHYVKYRLI